MWPSLTNAERLRYPSHVMITVDSDASRIAGLSLGDGFPLPGWVRDLVGPCRVSGFETDYADALSQVAIGEAYTLVSVAVRGAHSLAALDFQRATVEAYGAIAGFLAKGAMCHPIRFWNFIPGIHRAASDAMDRYMIFNAGRFAVFSDWFGDGDTLDRRVATATGIGHAGTDLVIHVLASDRPSTNVDNPRQTRPRCYSCRYGPLPPCFARASVIQTVDASQPLILLGGTSSVRGEQSVHPHNLARQVDETLRNLCNLLQTADRFGGRRVGMESETSIRLDRFREMRVYYARSDDETEVRRLIKQRLPHLDDIDYLRADICRRDLLVEIEGLADLAPARVGIGDDCRSGVPAPGRPEPSVP